MMEGGLTVEKRGSILRRGILVFGGLALFIVLIEAMKRLWLPQHRGVLGLIELVVASAMFILPVYWIGRTARSRGRPMPDGETCYEGSALHQGMLTGFLFNLALGLFILFLGLVLLTEGLNGSSILLVIGFFVLGAAALVLWTGFRSKLVITDGGVLWKQGTPSFLPGTYVSFDELGSIGLWGPVFWFRGKKDRPKGWFLVRNRKGLATALDRILERK